MTELLEHPRHCSRPASVYRLLPGNPGRIVVLCPECRSQGIRDAQEAP